MTNNADFQQMNDAFSSTIIITITILVVHDSLDYFKIYGQHGDLKHIFLSLCHSPRLHIHTHWKHKMFFITSFPFISIEIPENGTGSHAASNEALWMQEKKCSTRRKRCYRNWISTYSFRISEWKKVFHINEYINLTLNHVGISRSQYQFKMIA